MTSFVSKDAAWPALPWAAWKDTGETLHMWTQIVGKIKLALTPFLNEWWEVGFDVSARGLSTGLIPVSDRAFEIRFDFLEHKLTIDSSDGQRAELALFPRSVADFHAELFARLRRMGIDVAISLIPTETQPRIPFDQDSVHASYDPESVLNWWKILVRTTKVLQRYRSTFVGKSSPILFYWGSFDLSCARYSGRASTQPTSGPRFFKIAEDQENVCCGFWPGNPNMMGFAYGAPAFYSYTYPRPPGFESATLQPSRARFSSELGEYVLNYDDLLQIAAPEEREDALLQFFQSAYDAGSSLAGWDRSRLAG